MSAVQDGDGQTVAIPVDNPLSNLPVTAQKILAAARRLLVEKGYDAVTLEKVAAEAGVNKASIRYNFGNKAGLVASVVDSVIHEEFLHGAEIFGTMPSGDRVRALVEGKRHLLAATDRLQGLFDILPHALRDELLRRRIWSSYPWWAEQNLRLLGFEWADTEERPELLAGLGSLITAVVDGLAVQSLLEPDTFDVERPLRALEFLIDEAMPRLREMAGVTGEGG
jgi:AcrR family transcriptional regulator